MLIEKLLQQRIDEHNPIKWSNLYLFSQRDSTLAQLVWIVLLNLNKGV